MFRFTKADELAVWFVVLIFPLGLWKLIEILVWAWTHLSWKGS